MTKVEDLIGTVGRAVSPLRPAGKVELLGVTRDARSEGDWIDVESSVVVIRADQFGLVVRQATDEEAKTQQAVIPKRSTPSKKDRSVTGSPFSAQMITSAGWGLAFGLGLGLWLSYQTDKPPTDIFLAFPIGGLLVGVVHLVFLRAVFSTAHDVLTERIPVSPGILARVILPVLGGIGGALIGYLIGGTTPVIWGTIAGAFLFGPLLWILAEIVGEMTLP